MEERARRLAQELVDFHKELLRITPIIETEAPAALGVILAVPLARLTRTLIPNAQSKLDEIVFAADNTLKVNANTKGHDLSTSEGVHIERKVSTYTKKTPKCNFNWSIPKADTPEKKLDLLLASITEKTRGGCAILEVQDGLTRTLATFVLHEKFLLAYFTRLKCNSDRVNMGCARCRNCHKFHRLQNLADASKLMLESGGDPDVVAWLLLFAETSANCDVTPTS